MLTPLAQTCIPSELLHQLQHHVYLAHTHAEMGTQPEHGAETINSSCWSDQTTEDANVLKLRLRIAYAAGARLQCPRHAAGCDTAAVREMLKYAPSDQPVA